RSTRLAGELPQMPDRDPATLVEQRRADALVLLCGGGAVAADEADRATVVIHTQAGADGAIANGQIEEGGVVPTESLERLLCNARVQVVEEDRSGNATALGRRTRVPSAWMSRQVRHRDQECRFPGCGSRRFTEEHHIIWWSRGGRTDLDNLLLICSFHHKLVHEYGWVVKRAPDGDPRWFRPDGRRYRAGPDRIPISA
ncbi:MAG: HNH endonuclease, partial [Actinomycetota bacterium]|nr:HNH endonuclease [Actinomycetota bacterium]